MTRLWFVRHGPTHAKGMVGWSDIPADLTDLPALARLSAYLPDGAVVSSDLGRAIATADAIAGERLRLPNQPDLREIHFGAWELQTFAAVETSDAAAIRAFWDTPGDTAPPGGESWNALSARVGAAVDRLAQGHADLIVVAHFGAILCQVQRARRISATAAFAQKIDPLSVTSLVLGDTPHITLVNHRP